MLPPDEPTLPFRLPDARGEPAAHARRTAAHGRDPWPDEEEEDADDEEEDVDGEDHEDEDLDADDDDPGPGDDEEAALLDEDFPLGDGVADVEADVACPYCGAPNTVALDPGSGADQEYVEDCQVCCQPWRVSVRYAPDGSADVWLDAADGS